MQRGASAKRPIGHSHNLKVGGSNPPIRNQFTILPESYLQASNLYSAPVKLRGYKREKTGQEAWEVDWTTRRTAREGLFLTEAGFLPAEVPLRYATVIDQKDEYGAEPRTIKMAMTGNSAYLPKSERESYRAARLKHMTSASSRPASARASVGGSR